MKSISRDPRPQTLPSLTMPEKGFSSQVLGSSTGTTSTWEGPNMRRGPSPEPGILATRLPLPGADSRMWLSMPCSRSVLSTVLMDLSSSPGGLTHLFWMSSESRLMESSSDEGSVAYTWFLIRFSFI